MIVLLVRVKALNPQAPSSSGKLRNFQEQVWGISSLSCLFFAQVPKRAHFEDFTIWLHSQNITESSPHDLAGLPLTVRASATAGRGVYAAEEIAAGEVIQDAAPIVAHPTLNNIDKVRKLSESVFCLFTGNDISAVSAKALPPL